MSRRGVAPPVLAVLGCLLAVGGCSERPPPRSADPPPAGELVVALHEAPQGFDPHRQGDLVSQIVLANLCETLVDFGRGAAIEPRVARGWSNPDDLTWRFELRDDVRFADGRPLEAADVVASLERARDLQGSAVAGHLARVDEIRESEPGVVEIRTDGPAPLLLNGLTQVFLVPRDAPDRIDAEDLVGSGRYRLAEVTDGSIAFEAVVDHRDGAPDFHRVRLDIVPDQEERVERVLSGGADLANRLVATDADPLSRSSEVRRILHPSLQVPLLLLRPDRAPFADPRVRRALDLALDRVALAASRRGTAHGQLVGPEVFGHDADRPPPRFDPAEARKLLAAAGFPDGLDLVLHAGRGVAVDEVLESLAAVGIRVEVESLPFPELIAGLERGETSFAYLSIVASTGDALDPLESLAHSRSADGRFGVHNWIGLADPELDALIETAGRTLVLGERRRLLQAALARLAEHRVILPLITPSDVYGLRAGLEWRPRLDGRILAAEVRRGG